MRVLPVCGALALSVSLVAALGIGSPSIAFAEASSAHSGPIIDALYPALGDVLGGQVVTVRGSGMNGATGVCFGEKCVKPISSSPTEVRVVAPPHYGYQGGQANAVVADYQEGPVPIKVSFGEGAAGSDSARYSRYYFYKATSPLGRELAYAIRHWKNYDELRFGDINNAGGDCQNFVSAAMLARFTKDSSSIGTADWYNDYANWVAKNPKKNPYDDPYGYLDPSNKWMTPSWAHVPSFGKWLDSKKELGITRIDLASDPATLQRIQLGDVITFTWNDDELAAHESESGGPGLVPADFTSSASLGAGSDLGQDHSMIVTQIRDEAGNLDIRLAGHNNDRNYLKLSYVFAAYPHMTGSIWLLPSS